MSWIEARSGSHNMPEQLKWRMGRIAYLGASVTAQQEGYRSQLHLKLVQHFDRPHLPINAGIGGVGMIGGAFLMDDFVIARRPDYCFIEFSTADYSGPLPISESGAALEGVIRKLNVIQCKTCLLHLYRADIDYTALPAMVATFEKVAACYQIPSLHVGAHLFHRFRAGELDSDWLYKDIVHTAALGANQIAELVFQGIRQIWDTVPDAQPAAPKPSAPLHPHHYQFTEIAPATPAMLAGNGPVEVGQFNKTYDFVQVGFENEFIVAGTGVLVGMVVVVGPDSGIVEVASPTLTQRHQLWDRWCHYDRLQTTLFWPQIAPGTPVSVRLIDAPVDYAGIQPPPPASAKTLKVIGFMVRR